MNEKEAIDRVVNCLTDHNLIMGKDYIFKTVANGCFNIRICPSRYAVLDIMYFLEHIPDIVVFKVKQNRNVMNVNIKIRLR